MQCISWSNEKFVLKFWNIFRDKFDQMKYITWSPVEHSFFSSPDQQVSYTCNQEVLWVTSEMKWMNLLFWFSSKYFLSFLLFLFSLLLSTKCPLSLSFFSLKLLFCLVHLLCWLLSLVSGMRMRRRKLMKNTDEDEELVSQKERKRESKRWIRKSRLLFIFINTLFKEQV